MPNIQEYTAPNDSINTEAFQVGARRIGAFANQTAEDIRRAGLLQAQDISSTIKDVGEAALQHVEYADAGRTNAQTTAFLANTDQQWEDAKKNATPEQLADPNWVKDFQKNVVEPGLESITNSATSQRGSDYAQRKADEYRIHFTQKLMADASIAAGNNAALMRTRVVNNAAASVSVDPTFSNIDFNRKQLKDDLNVHLGRNSGGLTTISTASGKSVTVSAAGADRFSGFLKDLETAGAPLGEMGGYNPRNIAGTNILSKHASGSAIDVGSQSGRDTVSPEFRRWYDSHQPEVRAAMNKYGIVSGADWTNPDLGHFELAGGTPSGSTVTAAQDAKLREHGEKDEENVVQYGAIAALRKSPDPVKTANDFIDYYGPKGLLKPPEADMLLKSAATQAHQNEVAARAQEAHEEKQAGLAAEDKTNSIVNNVIQRGSVVAQDFKDLGDALADPQLRKGFNVKGGLARATNDWLQSQTSKEAKLDNPEVYNSLKDQVLDGTATIEQLMTANKPGGGLGDAHFKSLVADMKLKNEFGTKLNPYKNALKSIDELAIDRTAGPDPLGMAVATKIKDALEPVYTDALRKGTLEKNALDMTDPKSMIRQIADPLLQQTNLKNRTIVRSFLDATKTKPEEHSDGEGLLAKAKAWFTGSEPPVHVKDMEDVKARGLHAGTKIQFPNGDVRYVPEQM